MGTWQFTVTYFLAKLQQDSHIQNVYNIAGYLFVEGT